MDSGASVSSLDVSWGKWKSCCNDLRSGNNTDMEFHCKPSHARCWRLPLCIRTAPMQKQGLQEARICVLVRKGIILFLLHSNSKPDFIIKLSLKNGKISLVHNSSWNYFIFMPVTCVHRLHITMWAFLSALISIQALSSFNWKWVRTDQKTTVWKQEVCEKFFRTWHDDTALQLQLKVKLLAKHPLSRATTSSYYRHLSFVANEALVEEPLIQSHAYVEFK